MIIHHLNVDKDIQFVNFTSSVLSDGTHSSLMTVISELFVDIEKLTARFSVKLPENQKDEDYKRVFFRTSIDIEKFFKGIDGNYITKAIMGDFFTCIDFEPKFPLKKVTS